MILKDGATLQSGKYVIHAVLHQTDLGMTYQAHHVFLDQTVVLQTLNPAAKQAKDPQMWQQTVQLFMSGARHLAKHPSNHRLRAIDLFEEQIDGQNLPFVVLSFLPNQPPQKLGEWFVYLPEPTPAKVTPPQTAAQVPDQPQALAVEVPAPNSESVQAQSAQAQSAQASSQTVSEANGTPNGAAPNSATSNGAMLTTATPSAPIAESVAATQSVTPPITATAQPLNGRSPQKQSSSSVRVFVQPKRRLPNAFLLTALIAGATGAGMGFALRVHPSPAVKAPFNLGTGLFTREQSFPPEGNWPIHETPAVMQPEPTDSQPTYSAEPALQYTPPSESFPSTNYAPLPAAPAQPEPQFAAPADAGGSEAAAPEIDRASNIPPADNAAPPISREPIQPKPAPVAPAPAVVDPPPPVAPAPVMEPAPAAPAPPPARPPRPKSIDQ